MLGQPTVPARQARRWGEQLKSNGQQCIQVHTPRQCRSTNLSFQVRNNVRSTSAEPLPDPLRVALSSFWVVLLGCLGRRHAQFFRHLCVERSTLFVHALRRGLAQLRLHLVKLGVQRCEGLASALLSLLNEAGLEFAHLQQTVGVVCGVDGRVFWGNYVHGGWGGAVESVSVARDWKAESMTHGALVQQIGHSQQARRC